MKKTKAQKGITLIALIITIVVLLILAVVTISAVQDGGIIQYATNSAAEYEMGKEKETAQIDKYGTYIKENTLTEEQLKQEFENEFKKWEADYLAEHNNEAPTEFEYGDYKYINTNGWRVTAINREKEQYGLILSEAFEVDIVYLESTFAYCLNLKSFSKGFEIPSSVTRMGMMFGYCTSLEKLPDNFSIPEGATEIYEMFKNCTSLTLANLENGLVIPSNVEFAREVFKGCTSLTGTIVINSTKFPSGGFYGYYQDFFNGTTQPITLTTTAGISEVVLNNLAGTSTSGNVTVEI